MSTLLSSLLGLVLILAAGFLLTTRAIPWVFVRALRAVGFRAKASPVTLKRIGRFKRIRRGYYCFLGITTLFVTSLFLELIVNGRALAIHYEGRTAFPAFREWASKALFFTSISFFERKSDFGQVGDDEVDYRRFAACCADPGVLRREIDKARAKLEEERAQLDRDKKVAKTMSERMRLAAKGKSIERRTSELADNETAHAVFASGHAWCLMPLYRYGPSEFRHDLLDRPPNKPAPADGIPLGTDMAGRDVFVLLVYGFRISLAFALVVATLGYAFGITMGAVQGYYGGWVDIVLQRIEEIWASIPFLLTVMIIASMTTPTFPKLIVIFVVLSSWLGITTFMRAEFYREKAKDYVQAAIGFGVSDLRIMTRHILPNAIVPIVTLAPFALVGNISGLVALDFLGFGLPPGTPSWGNLLHQGLENVKFDPHLVTVPTAAFVLTLWCVVTIGEAVREAFDPKVFSRLR